MPGKQRISGEVEVKCSPHQVLEMFKGKQEHVPNICSDKIIGVESHHDDWVNFDTTRRWDYNHDGEPRYLTEKFDSVDDETNTVALHMVDGTVMKLYYKTFVSIIQATPIPIPEGGSESSLVKWTIEYEKFEESAPDPQYELDFCLSMIKDIGDHHADSNAQA